MNKLNTQVSEENLLDITVELMQDVNKFTHMSGADKKAYVLNELKQLLSGKEPRDVQLLLVIASNAVEVILKASRKCFKLSKCSRFCCGLI